LKPAIQLSATGHIESATLFAQELEDVDIPAALDRVTDRRMHFGKRIANLPIVMQKRRLRIHENRCSHLARNLLCGHVLAVQLAVLVIEKIHSDAELSPLWRRMQLIYDGRRSPNKTYQFFSAARFSF